MLQEHDGNVGRQNHTQGRQPIGPCPANALSKPILTPTNVMLLQVNPRLLAAILKKTLGQGLTSGGTGAKTSTSGSRG
jgi:hypothetical protein